MNQFTLFFILFFISNLALAEESSIKFSGFIDTYYAYDSNRPSKKERAYTTQAVRHNELNVNLAYLDAIISKEKYRGRIALQAGNSVTRNYSAEPDGVKYIQEAFAGLKIGDRSWIDAGIFLGNIGAESWISKDNWTYTRALNLDYVPYFSSGIRFSHEVDAKQSFQIQLLNGWQNIKETNNSKAIGLQYRNLLSDRVTFTYNNFFGEEEVVSDDSKFRSYHNFIIQYLWSEKWQYLTALDVGDQERDVWWSTTMTIRRVFNLRHSMAFRAEYYNDRHEANVVTGTSHGFEVIGASINYDFRVHEKALWRTEVRGLNSKDEIFPEKKNLKNRSDGLFVTSLSMWF